YCLNGIADGKCDEHDHVLGSEQLRPGVEEISKCDLIRSGNARYAEEDSHLYRHEYSIMKHEEYHEEESVFHGNGILVCPGMGRPGEHHYRHLQDLHESYNDCLEAIYQEYFLWPPAQEECAENGNSICRNQEVIASCE